MSCVLIFSVCKLRSRLVSVDGVAETSDRARTGCVVQCSGKQHSTAQHSREHGAPHTYLPMIEFSTSTGGNWQGGVPSLHRIHCCCAPPCLAVWFEVYLAFLLSLEGTSPVIEGARQGASQGVRSVMFADDPTLSLQYKSSIALWHIYEMSYQFCTQVTEYCA